MSLIIACDPGHPSYKGDMGGGTSPCGRIVECDYTMHIARMLNTSLASENDIGLHLLRSRNDEVVSLKERGKRASSVNADLVLSIHVNSAPNSSWSGGIIFYWPGNVVGAKVAEQIAHSWPASLRRDPPTVEMADRHMYPGVWAVLGAYEQTAVLAECGFATNRHDVDLMVEPTVQEQIVGALHQGIRRFKQISEIPSLE
jgi:N-acetylmuramoyl-L-alanine amidase